MVRVDVVLALLRQWLRLHRAVRVHRIAQLFRRLEERNPLRRNIHLRSGLRVAPCPGVALPCPEAAKSANLDLVPGLQGTNCGHLLYEVGFCHMWCPYLLGRACCVSATKNLSSC